MKKMTLLFAIAAFTFSTGINAQNYGMKATGTFGDGFYSNDIQSLLSSQSAFTIEFWYQIETYTANTWIFKMEDSGNTNNRIGLFTAPSDSGVVYVRLGDGTNHGQQPFWTANDSKYPGGAFNASVGHRLTATEGLWNHVALTFNAGVVKLYIDGLLLTGQAITGSYPTTTGNYSGVQFQMNWTTDANIDELRITKGTALSAIDIAKSNNPTNFDAYFDFNANERPTGAAASSIATANIGSDATVKGFINNMGTTYQVTDNTTLGAKNFDKANTLQVYPNPATDYVTVQLPNNTSGKVSIYSITGKLLIQKTVNVQKEFRLNTNTLTKGVYMLSFENETTKKVSKLIVR